MLSIKDSELINGIPIHIQQRPDRLSELTGLLAELMVNQGRRWPTENEEAHKTAQRDLTARLRTIKRRHTERIYTTRTEYSSDRKKRYLAVYRLPDQRPRKQPEPQPEPQLESFEPFGPIS